MREATIVIDVVEEATSWTFPEEDVVTFFLTTEVALTFRKQWLAILMGVC